MQTVGCRVQLHCCLYRPTTDEQETPGQSEQSGAHRSAKRHHVPRSKQTTLQTQRFYRVVSQRYTYLPAINV